MCLPEELFFLSYPDESLTLFKSFCIVSTEIPVWSIKILYLWIDAEPLVENLNFLCWGVSLCKQIDGFSRFIDCLIYNNDRMSGVPAVDNYISNLQFFSCDGGQFLLQ